jgi:sodium-dependent dicarboxylate transporter 2/3/5
MGLYAGPVLALLLILFADLNPGHPAVTRTAAIALWMATWWMTEALPLGVTALLPIVLFPLMGIMNGKQVAPQYFNHIIFLFIGGFIVALAMERWNLHRRIALKTLMVVGVQPRNILLGFMGTTAFLSMWISNTAATMMMVPIALAVIQQLEELSGGESTRKYAIGLFLSIAYGATLGGISTLVGTPPNLVFAKVYASTYPQAPEISFASWMVFALPITAVFLVVVWRLLTFLFVSKNQNLAVSQDIFNNQYSALGSTTYEERVVLAGFCTLVILWLFRTDIHLGALTIPGWSHWFTHPEYFNDGTAAIFISILLFLAPSKSGTGEHIMNWGTAKRLPWDIVLLFGGGFALAFGFKESGLSQWLGDQLAILKDLAPLAIVAGVCTLLIFLTELTSNTATAQIFLPILAILATEVQLNPVFLMVPGTLACSLAFMLPVATPPNAIIFGTGRIKIGAMAKVGLVLNMVGIVLLTLAIYSLGAVVLGIDLTSFPAWAGM